MEELNYENDMQIDPSIIDEEWVKHTKVVFKYGKYYSNLEKQLALEEESFELLVAQLTDYVNSNVEETLGKGVKSTVANVNSFLVQNEQYQEKKRSIIELKHEVRIAKIAYDQLSNGRKTALENLVKLLQQNYFAGPAIPRDLTFEILQKEKLNRTDAGVAQRLRRK